MLNSYDIMPKYDIIFCSVPFTDIDHIYSAPAVLKGVVMSMGFQAKTLDAGMELFRFCKYDPEKFNNLQLYFITKGKKLSFEESNILDSWFDYLVKYFQENTTRYIGISVLSYYTHKSTLMLIELLRKNNINSKIMLGGSGLNVRPWSGILDQFNALEATNVFGRILLNRKLADKIIFGDGEDAVVKALESDDNEITVPTDVISYPEPNYEDYKFDAYVTHDGGIYFPITGSKGCVRNCDFCDVAYHSGKFRTRAGKDIAKEMINVQKKYGFDRFEFTDSLVNGGLKVFREFCEILAEHNKINPDRKIRWKGQYICRPAKQMPQDLYPLMSDAGAFGLSIGAESGSDSVLEAMNKKTTNSALYHELEQFRKYQIKCSLLTFVGHWRETHENFKDHCKMLIKILPYVRSNVIGVVDFGGLAEILDGTPSMNLVHSGQISTSDFSRELLWFNEENPMGIKERIFRRLFLFRMQEKLRFPTYNDIGKIIEIYDVVFPDKDRINQFYAKYSTKILASPAEKIFDNFDQVISELCQEKNLEIILDIEVDDYNGSPELLITVNGNTVFEKTPFKKGNHTVSISTDSINQTKNKIEISMLGKKEHDTLIENGRIVRDKFIKINNLSINNYSINDDPDFFMQHFRYIDGSEVHLGFWSNQTLTFEYEGAFSLWYNTRSSNNFYRYKPILSEKDSKFIVNKLVNLARSLK